MVPDPLQVLGDEQEVRRLTDVVRVLHHVREQSAEDGLVEVVDRVVALAYADRSFGVALDEGVENVVHHPGRDARHFGKQRERFDLPDILEQRNALGDVLGIVADALDDARDLERCNDVAKVAGHRCAQGDELHGAPLRLDLEHVELLVLSDDALGALDVALGEAAHGFADRVLGKAAHLADERAQPVEILIECLERMFAALLHWCSRQPYRPVI